MSREQEAVVKNVEMERNEVISKKYELNIPKGYFGLLRH